MSEDVIVLGAGMVGVTSALALRESGFNVSIIEIGAPGREASYGNAGIIQAEAAEPYALPQDLGTLGKVRISRLSFSLVREYVYQGERVQECRYLSNTVNEERRIL